MTLAPPSTALREGHISRSEDSLSETCRAAQLQVVELFLCPALNSTPRTSWEGLPCRTGTCTGGLRGTGQPVVLRHLYSCPSGPEASIGVNVPGERLPTPPPLFFKNFNFFKNFCFSLLSLLFPFRHKCHHVFILSCKIWFLKSHCPLGQALVTWCSLQTPVPIGVFSLLCPR